MEGNPGTFLKMTPPQMKTVVAPLFDSSLSESLAEITLQFTWASLLQHAAAQRPYTAAFALAVGRTVGT